MPLDDLLELIEALQSRMDAHSAELQKSEALTRYALIDPLLRALGWDTADPSQVLVEFQSGGGSADYALLAADEKPRIIVEAKRLGTPLQGAVTQGINYCIQLGIPYFALTDGQRWELYETFRPVPLGEKLVVKLDMRASAAKTCLDSLALWQPSARMGSIGTGVSPVTQNAAQTGDFASAPGPAPQQIESDGKWQNLAELSPVGGTKPAEVKFPSGVTGAATSWAEVITNIVQWLFDERRLPQARIPIGRPQTKRLILAEKPIHRDGAPFKGRRQVGPYFIHTGYSASDQMNNARFIIESVDLNPEEFAVRLQ